MGIDDFGLGLMLAAGQIKSHKGSYVGENRLLEEMVLTGRIDLELIPQGTLRRTHSRWRSGNSSLLHSHGIRHGGCRRQRDARV